MHAFVAGVLHHDPLMPAGSVEISLWPHRPVCMVKHKQDYRSEHQKCSLFSEGWSVTLHRYSYPTATGGAQRRRSSCRRHWQVLCKPYMFSKLNITNVRSAHKDSVNIWGILYWLMKRTFVCYSMALYVHIWNTVCPSGRRISEKTLNVWRKFSAELPSWLKVSNTSHMKRD